MLGLLADLVAGDSAPIKALDGHREGAFHQKMASQVRLHAIFPKAARLTGRIVAYMMCYICKCLTGRYSGVFNA